MSFIRNQAVTGLPDTSYRMRVSEDKRWRLVKLSLRRHCYATLAVREIAERFLQLPVHQLPIQ